jgi:hypothetical protein
LQRQWYADESFDLIVWRTTDGSVRAFQLCHRRGDREGAVSWQEDGAVSQERVDGGEDSPVKNRAPILVAGRVFTVAEVVERFRANRLGIDPRLESFIIEKLLLHPEDA